MREHRDDDGWLANASSARAPSRSLTEMTDDPAHRRRTTAETLDLDRVMLASPDRALSAVFIPAAGMLCSSLRHHDEELLSPGSGVAAYAARGATMGVPLLYPWANRLAGYGYETAGQTVRLVEGSPRLAVDENGLPIHGVIPGELSWKLESVSRNGSALSASLDWDAPALLEIFPFPHRVGYEATITAHSLTIVVTVEANRGEPVPVSFGFHPYISIAGAPRPEWAVELSVSERLLLDDAMIPTGARESVSLGPLRLGDKSWDDPFVALAPPAHFIVSSRVRTIAIDFLEGYGYAQVYSPSDAGFVCVEPMTAPTNALASGEGLTVVRAGSGYRASFRLGVKSTERPSG